MAAPKKDAKPKDNDEKVAAPEANAEAKQKKKKLFMMIGLGLLLVVISVGATVGALKFLSPKSSDVEHETVDGAEQSEEHASSDESNSDDKSKADELKLPAVYYALKPNFTVNFDVNGRQRFLQTELTAVYRNPEVLHFLELHMPDLRNGLVMLLSSQSFDELQTVDGKEKLRADALKIVQDILIKEQLKVAAADKEKSKDKKKKVLPNIEQILFTHFVMQ